ncbi:MAG: hypothetical protein ACRD5Z_07065, partial [Bryobacteraceae bacterium]
MHTSQLRIGTYAIDRSANRDASRSMQYIEEIASTISNFLIGVRAAGMLTWKCVEGTPVIQWNYSPAPRGIACRRLRFGCRSTGWNGKLVIANDYSSV